MWLGQEDSDFAVIDVVSDGPAERVGIKTGDKILAVDGKPADGLDVVEIREEFRKNAVGSTMRLRVQSGAVAREVVVTLRDLVRRTAKGHGKRTGLKTRRYNATTTAGEWEDAMLGGRTWESWIAEYAEGHQHPVNRITHTFGIPIIILSGPVALAGIFWHRLLWVALGLFVFGWVLQFIGHAAEGKPPEFFKDWRFLLVGSRWWAAKMRGKA